MSAARRLLVVLPLALALIFLMFAAISRLSREKTEDVASSVAARMPYTTIEVCGYHLSTKLRKHGYDVEQWARFWSRKGCAHLDANNRCLLACAEKGGAPDNAGGCSQLCSGTAGTD